MIVIKNRVIYLTIEEIDGDIVTFSVNDGHGKTVVVAQQSEQHADELEPVEVNISRFLDADLDLRPNGVVAVKCDLYYEKIGDEMSVLLDKATLTTESISPDYQLISDTSDLGSIHPLSIDILNEWISELRQTELLVSFIHGYESTLAYGMQRYLSDDLQEGYHEYAFNTLEETEAFTSGLLAVTSNATLILLTKVENEELIQAINKSSPAP